MPKISQYPELPALTGQELVLMDSGPSTNRQTVTASTSTFSAAIASGIGIFNTAHSGVVPASPGGTTTVLRADGTWSASFTGTWTFPTLNSTTIGATTGNVVTLNSTTIGATTGNIVTLNSTTVSATTGNVTTLNSTTANVTTLAASSQVTIGASSAPAYDAGTGNIGYWARTAAETLASVTPVNFVYAPGDLRRYGCDVSGGTDNTTQITNAINAAIASSGTGYIFHPGGTIVHASQILIPVGGALAVLGWSRANCIFKFTGSPAGSPAYTRSGWRYAGPNINPWSGYANVVFRHVQLWYVNNINFAAALEINAYGLSYFEVDDCWIKGGCSYGVILDGTEICSVHNCLIENINATANANVWIVNGNDRGFTQGTGFSNVITIRENQISSNSAVSIGLQDDGGNAHVIEGNNFNGHRFPINIAGLTNSPITGNSFETAQQTGSANMLVQSVSSSGNPVGACTGLLLSANGFYGSMSAGSLLTFSGTAFNISAITQAANAVVTFSTVSSVNPFLVSQQIAFTGILGMVQLNSQSAFVLSIGGSSGAWTATLNLNTVTYTAYSSGGTGKLFHSGIKVEANTFGAQLGRGGAIDVTYLANSLCTANNDQALASPGGSSMSHYIGVHNDSWGNRLDLPQNGGVTAGNVGVSGPTFGDNRTQTVFQQGQALLRLAVTYSASMTVDASLANYFTITVTNGSGFTINSPLSPLGGEQIQFVIRNASGGALGTITWNAVFKINATAVAPANGQSRSIAFMYDGANWVEQWRGAVDVPN